MPSKNRIKWSRTTAKDNWRTMSLDEKRAHIPVGSVFHMQHADSAPYARKDTFRLEWGRKGTNRGTMTVHGTEEQARALMTHAYMTLRIAEDMPNKETVQALLQSFCVQTTNGYNKLPMWEITRDIPQTNTTQTQYQRAHSFLRSLLIRTLRNIYESATGEVIK